MDEVKQKRGIHPVWFFVILSLVTIVLSFIFGLLNLQGTEYSVSQSGKVTGTIITVNSLLGRTGMKFIIGESINNLLKFIPFGAIIIGMLGIGTVIKTGLLKELFSRMKKVIPRSVMFFMFSLLCIVMGFSQELSFIVMIPVSIVLFTEYRRSQIIGMTFAFVSVAAGANINLFITSIDYSLIEIAKNSVKIIDKDYTYGYSGNIFIIVVASLLLALTLTLLTEFISRNKPVRISDDEDKISEKSKKLGIKRAAIAFVILTIIFIYSIIPGLPLSGGLLDNDQVFYVNKLFGANSPFVNGILYVVSISAFICGLVYGITTKQIKGERDLVRLLSGTLNNIGELLFIVFCAAEFISIFKYSNIGEVFTSIIFNIIKNGNLSFLVLILIAFLGIFVAGLLLPSIASKWQMFVPGILPLFMKSNITPEFTGAIFRLASGLSNVLSPVFPYFAIYIGFMALYNKIDYSIKKSYGLLCPYFIAVFILFLFIIFAWYTLGLPIGRGTYPTI